MQRNLRMVVNKLNVVVVSAVVILVLLLTVVSSIRVIGVIEDVSVGMAIEKAEIIKTVPEANNILEIVGVDVVNPNGVFVPVHVQDGVVPPVTSRMIICGSRGFVRDQVRVAGPVGVNGLDIAHSAIAATSIDFIRNGIYQRTEIDGDIPIATVGQSTIANVRAVISSMDTADAAIIASIDAAPIFGNYIGGREAEAIARNNVAAAQDIGDSKIMDIAAAETINRSGGNIQIV
jgi:hypothetical protein